MSCSETNQLNMQTLFLTPPINSLKATIIVPVKNEEANLYGMLDALRLQVNPNGDRLAADCYEVLLLANNCTDTSFELAKQYQQQYPGFRLHIAEIVLEKKRAHIGTVRRLLMDEAYHRFQLLGNPDGIIISTDGDSRVDRCWLHYIFEEFDNGCDVVGGRIISEYSESPSRKYHLKDVGYRYLVSHLESCIDPCAFDPWPRHFQCFGPSTAVKCSIYEKAGRLPVLPFLEDENFRKALIRIDARIRRSPNVKVYTSSRESGQVDFGFSIQLNEWTKMKLEGKKIFVEAPGSLMIKFSAKKELRELFTDYLMNNRLNMVALRQLARKLFLDEEWLSVKISSATYFGSLWEETEQALSVQKWEERHPGIPIDAAIGDLRTLLYARQPA
jgi:glycosyltransferase involved in cell wall biosynthesis